MRPGNVHSADGWRDLLEPIVDRYRAAGKRIYFRGDAAFASPDVCEYLEDNGVLYAMRIKANSRLYDHVEHLMTRPVGRPSVKPKAFYHDFSYRAASWDRSRRVIAKIEWHQGELFPRVGFIVTNLSRAAKNVVRFYNQRGRCENHIKEGKYALSWTRLSCSRFISNQVRLALFVLAYNLANFLRRLALPAKISHWSLSSVQLKLIKIGAKVVSHTRRTVFQMAEVAVTGVAFRRGPCPHQVPGSCSHLRQRITEGITYETYLERSSFSEYRSGGHLSPRGLQGLREGRRKPGFVCVRFSAGW